MPQSVSVNDEDARADVCPPRAGGLARLARLRIETPVGPMIAIATPDALCVLEFDEPGRLERLARRFEPSMTRETIVEERTPVIENTQAWLAEYFDGDTPPSRTPQLRPCGTAFEQRVWAALLTIPPGGTTTYGALARQIGAVGGSRAVGLANGSNSLALVIPCHRVIGANGTLTGYGGGLDRKQWLLDHERRWRRDRLF